MILSFWSEHLNYESCLQEDSITGYKALGGKVGEDWEDTRPYTEEVWGMCGLDWYCKKTVENRHTPNDCLCTLESMKLRYNEETNLGNFALNHHHTRTDLRIRQIIYKELLPDKSKSLYRMKDFTENTLKASMMEQFTPLAQPNIVERPLQYTCLTGTIHSSEIKNEEKTILGGSVSIYLLWDQTKGDLDLQAINPEGEVIDSDNVQKTAGTISLVPSSFIGGLWNFQIISGDLLQSINYKLIVYMNTYDLQINPSTDKYDYLVGENVKVFAEVTSDSGPILVPEVSANIYTLENNILLGQITLYDNGSYGDEIVGDCIYTNNEWIPTEKGKKKFEITALFRQDGEEFYSQSTQIIVNVIDTRVTFDGSGSDQGIDTNENEKYDLLKIDLQLTSSVTGNYSLSAELYDPSDNFISSAQEKVSLSEGTYTVELDFSGKDIFDLALSGPYHLKNVVIISSEGELMAFAEDIYTTTAYNYTDFEGPSLFLSDDYPEEGVDDDNDGKFNYLRWSFHLTALMDGTYRIKATLKTLTGQPIDIVSNDISLKAGENIKAIYFEGIKIRNTCIDGPYVLDDLSITNGGYTTTLEKVCITKNYHYSDFEEIDLPDISISSDNITFQFVDLNSIAVSVKVYNDGMDTSDNFTIQVYQGPKCAETLIGESIVEGLGKGGFITKLFNWNIEYLSENFYTVYVYLNDDRILSEYDYTNNLAFKDIAKRILYLDIDKDGFGDPNNSLQSLSVPQGYTETTEDCVDTNPSINPEAIEACDEVDNNCNGEIDEENAQGCTVYYRDTDSDGYGVGTANKCLCSPDYVNKYTALQEGDQDDLNPSLVIAVQQNLPAGWNMISLPVDPPDRRIKTLYPEARSVFEFTNEYVLLDPNAELGIGKGYWIYLQTANSYSMAGIPIDSHLHPNALPGWSMVGACTYLSTPILGQGEIRAVFGFSNKYELLGPDVSFQPGKGYWINLSEQGNLEVKKK